MHISKRPTHIIQQHILADTVSSLIACLRQASCALHDKHHLKHANLLIGNIYRDIQIHKWIAVILYRPTLHCICMSISIYNRSCISEE